MDMQSIGQFMPHLFQNFAHVQSPGQPMQQPGQIGQGPQGAQQIQGGPGGMGGMAGIIQGIIGRKRMKPPMDDGTGGEFGAQAAQAGAQAFNPGGFFSPEMNRY